MDIDYSVRKKADDINNQQGSATVETAIIFPVIMAVLLFGYICIGMTVNYFSIGRCFDQTAEQLSDYAYIYHEKLISEFSGDARGSIEAEIDGAIDKLLLKVPEFISETVDIKGYVKEYEKDFLDRAEDQIYIPIAYSLFMMNTQNVSDIQISNINFSESRFFNPENEITLEMKCTLPLPIAFFNNNGVEMTYKIKVNAWVNGIGKPDEDVSDIWKLDNFERGRKIRSMFGANLPDNFPVIASFKSGRATMIKSLDFRKETYSEEGAITEAVVNMLDKLCGFKGQETPWGKEGTVVKGSEIRERELILVIPADTATELLNSEIVKAESAAKIRGVVFSLKRL